MLLSRIIFIAISFVIISNPAFAQEDKALNDQKFHEDTAQEIYYETLSPFCPGRALADCPTEQSRDLKAQMLEDLKAGKSKQDVINKFLKDYGQHLSSIPSFSGLNSIAWLLPIFLLIIGLIVVIRRTRSNNSNED